MTGLKSSLWAALALFVGLLAITALVAYYGFAGIVAALETAGWRGFLAICAIHALVIAICGCAWWVLMPPDLRRTPWRFIAGRFVRDAGSEMLPLSQIGGYVLGARAVTVQGTTGAIAIATTIVDVTMELVAQLVYTALGLGLLLWLRPHSALALPLGIGLLVTAVITVVFIVAQQRGVITLEELAESIGQKWFGKIGEAGVVQDFIRTVYRYKSGVRWGFALHLIAWLASAGEVWVALRFLDAPLAIGAVIAIESLLYAIRSVAFMVPNALGVQEGAYVMLGAVFGLSPQTALALSLLKRGRDLTLGIPAFALWQSLEGNRFLRKRVRD